MSTLQELEKQVAALSPGEKAELLQWVARDVCRAAPGIESTPGVCGGEPCIIRTRIPVWVLLVAQAGQRAEQFMVRVLLEQLPNAGAVLIELVLKREDLLGEGLDLIPLDGVR